MIPISKINKTIIRTINKKTNFENIIDKGVPRFYIFPFSIQLGYIASSSAGYQGWNVRPNDYPSYQRIFDGEEQIIVNWDNSSNFNTFTSKTKEEDNYITEEHVVGD